jgi:hypothetical protein
MSKNQKGLLKWNCFFLKKWFSLEMVWNPEGREKVCDDKNFIYIFNEKDLAELLYPYNI